MDLEIAMGCCWQEEGGDFHPGVTDLNAAYRVTPTPRTWCCKEVIGEGCSLRGCKCRRAGGIRTVSFPSSPSIPEA